MPWFFRAFMNVKNQGEDIKVMIMEEGEKSVNLHPPTNYCPEKGKH